MSYFDEPGAPQEYAATAGIGAVGPGIDISHYGAPYAQMLGLGGYGVGEYVSQPLGSVGMLYRYGAGLGVPKIAPHGSWNPSVGPARPTPSWHAVTHSKASGRSPSSLLRFRSPWHLSGLGAVGPWSPGPGQRWSDDPRMVKRFTIVRSTYRVRNLGGERTAKVAADRVLAKARALFAGNTVRRIGTTGWTSDGKVGYEVILANVTRAGEIRGKNYQAGQQAAAAMGGGVEFYDASTIIPANAYVDAPPEAPATPEVAPSAEGEEEPFLSRKVAGLPVWAVGLLGMTVVGGLGYMALRPKKKAAVAANRRGRKRRRRRRRRR